MLTEKEIFERVCKTPVGTLAKELNICAKTIRRRFPDVANSANAFRKSEARKLRDRKSYKISDFVNRKCLNCSIDFIAESRFYRLCNRCRVLEE